MRSSTESFWQNTGNPSEGAGSGASPSSNAHGTRSSGSFFPGWLRQRQDGCWLQQQLLMQGGGQGVLFRGLRVRMGVATGVVAKGREVKNSAVYKTAQGERSGRVAVAEAEPTSALVQLPQHDLSSFSIAESALLLGHTASFLLALLPTCTLLCLAGVSHFTDVSNAANGGQVLMDEPTFAAVKEGMRRLGLITADGLDYDKLYASSKHGAKHSSSKHSRGGHVRRLSGSGVSSSGGVSPRFLSCIFSSSRGWAVQQLSGDDYNRTCCASYGFHVNLHSFELLFFAFSRLCSLCFEAHGASFTFCGCQCMCMPLTCLPVSDHQ
jgi:hypothetical protein